MKKILFFINTLGTGGAEHVLVDIVNKLNPEKFDITIKTIYDINVYKDQINNNIKVESYYRTKKNKFWDKICRRILYWKIKYYKKEWLYKKFVKGNFDIEVAFLEGLPTKVIAGSSNKNSKKVAWVHIDLNINKESYIFYKNMKEQKDVYNKYNEIYCVSDEALESFKKIYNINENVYALYNIVNKNKIINDSKEELILPKVFNILNVGRLTNQKAQTRLIEAYSKVVKKINFETHLYIAGEGEERENIENAINKYKLNKNVTLLGNQKNPYKYMKNCDLYVCSSYAEGYSLVILEALTLGLPVLTTECAGMKQILNNGEFGMIVKNDVKSLTEGFLNMLNGEMLKNYKKNIKNNYSKYENKIDKIEAQLLK